MEKNKKALKRKDLHVMGIVLSIPILKEIDRIAKEEDRSRSSTIRQLLAEAIENRTKQAA